MATLTVDVVSDIRTLVTLEPAWWSLWHRSRMATPFQSPAWLIPWWRTFGSGELFAVVVWHQARLLGMAPLYVESASGELMLRPLGISVGGTIDLLADAAWEDEVLNALADFLATCPTPWDIWDMPDVPADGLALRFRPSLGWQDAVAAASPCRVLALSADTAIPEHAQRALAHAQADRPGKVAIRRAEPASANALVDKLFRFDPRLKAFHGEVIPKLMRADLARIYTLSIGSATAAAYYGTAHAGRHYAYVCGVDPAYECASMETILVAHAIEEAVREGAREFYVLRDERSDAWGAVDRHNRRRVISRRVNHARAS